MDKEKQEQRCFFQGVVYPNQKEWIKGIQLFYNSPLNAQSCEQLFRELIETVKLNLVMQLLDNRITNEQFRDILGEALEFIIEKASLQKTDK